MMFRHMSCLMTMNTTNVMPREHPDIPKRPRKMGKIEIVPYLDFLEKLWS